MHDYTLPIPKAFDKVKNLGFLDGRYVNVTGDTMTGDLGFTGAGINTTDYVYFNTSFTNGSAEGRLSWNDDDGTLNLGMKGGVVNLQIGQEQLVRATNDQGSQINNGSAVYISGAVGNNPQIKLANASQENGVQTIAIATEDIVNNQKGYVTTFGLVRDIDTSFCAAGERVFLDAVDGGLTNEKLNHPNFRISVGYCLRSHKNEGVLFVNINPEQWLKRFQTMREPTGFDADQSDLRGDVFITNNDRTFKIQPKGGQTYFNFWIDGREYRKTEAETLEIDDTEGLHYIYYDDDGSLAVAVNPSDSAIDQVIRKLPIVAIIYWDADNNEYVWFNEERHLNQMDGSTHSNLHFTRGTQWVSGGALGDFDIGDTANDSGAQFSVATGTILDEDINSMEQAIVSTSGVEIMYRSGTRWRRTTEAGFSVLTDTTAGIGSPTGRLVYNPIVAGSGNLATVSDNKYVLAHILQTNGSRTGEKYFAIVGQEEYLTLSGARLGATTEVNSLITTGLPGPEYIFLGTVIFQTKSSYTNSVNATIRQTDTGADYVDWRTTELTARDPAGNHSALSGLTNDDHTQYVLADGARVLTGDWNRDSFMSYNGWNQQEHDIDSDETFEVYANNSLTLPEYLNLEGTLNVEGIPDIT